MIKKFSTLYAGHVDLDNIGIDGTGVNDRRYQNEHLVSVFDKTEAIASLIDQMGYDTLWMAEHHFQPEGYECIPNLLMLSVHLAHITERVKFGCAFNIAPMWHPLRLAEDFAMADILTKGRVVFGVGRGYHTREVETFGAPMLDAEANRDLFEEQIEIILKSFDEESFSHQGKNYTFPPRVPYRGYELEEITLVPRPVHRPVDIWQPIVSSTPRGMDFMAKHKIKGIVGWHGTVGPDRLRQYKDSAAAEGRDLQLGEDLCIGFSFHLDDNKEKAMRSATPFFEENMKMFAPLGFVRGITDEQLRSLAGPNPGATSGLPTIEGAVQDQGWLCGSPEELIGSLKEFEAKYPGVEHINVSAAVGTPQRVLLEQLEWFAKEVMPAFIPRTVAADGGN